MPLIRRYAGLGGCLSGVEVAVCELSQWTKTIVPCQDRTVVCALLKGEIRVALSDECGAGGPRYKNGRDLQL